LEHAGAGLERIAVDALRRIPRDQAPLMAWALVCGSAVAERTRAASFLDGVLRIEVADAGWRRELQGLAPRYLATINRYVGHYAGQSVQRIEFVVVPDLNPVI
jgi:predicted nucleic acid-binding Zn ribbon protein